MIKFYQKYFLLIKRFYFKIATILGYKFYGFFVPYRYMDVFLEERKNIFYNDIYTKFLNSKDFFKNLLLRIGQFSQELQTITINEAKAKNGGRNLPRWHQDWFPRLDAAVAYTLTRLYKPSKIIEIGSGHSTRFFIEAIRDGQLRTHMTVIDPKPRASFDVASMEFIQSNLKLKHKDIFISLKENDMVFIDSSHILIPGSDVDLLINVILPQLPSGVLVHIHDIFLPQDYPKSWAWRGYNEQLIIIPLILSDQWQVIFASHFVKTQMMEDLKHSIVDTLPLLPTAYENSLWLQKK
ncbi:MAG: class I SAM-dependent methyltransferase [Alphaproteobacteria bacterium]|nr:class I SAM-dependent methyltransferase [Alphaproteobacteria bacterium]